MKNSLVLIAILCGFSSFGQHANEVRQDTILSYNDVIKVNSVPKEELFIRARDWLNTNLQGLQIQDKTTGEISARGITDGKVTFRMFGKHVANATFSFNVTIWVKDDRYMYWITNINNTSITYGDETASIKNDVSAPVGLLFTSDHAKAQILGLSQTRSDETYQSAKAGFDEIASGLITSLVSDMRKTSTPIF